VGTGGEWWCMVMVGVKGGVMLRNAEMIIIVAVTIVITVSEEVRPVEAVAITIILIVMRLEIEIIVIVNDNDYKLYYVLSFKVYLVVLISIPDVRPLFKMANLMLTLLLELRVYTWTEMLFDRPKSTSVRISEANGPVQPL